ncbi:MAG: methyltransferase domain-containing protein [Candidatus Gottesmanbacteria bacterium]
MPLSKEATHVEETLFLLERYFPSLIKENDGADFQPVKIDYRADFPPPENDLIALRERVGQRKEIVEMVFINIPREYTLSEGRTNLSNVYVLLGLRAPGEGETGHFAIGTWAPVMGFIEQKDLDWGIASARFSGKINMGKVIKWAAFRERHEEINQLPVQTDEILAPPLLHLPTGRHVHCIAEVVRAVSVSNELGISLGDDQQLSGKRTLMSTPVPASNEHTEFAWFPLSKLPTNMHPWSQRAVFLAIDALIKKGYLGLDIERDQYMAKVAPKEPYFLLEGTKLYDPIEEFFKQAFPYLFSAFNQWQRTLQEQGPEEIKHYLNIATNIRLEEIDKMVQGMFILAYGTRDSDLILRHFPAQISGIKIPQTVEEANQAISAWWELMSRKTWEEIDPDFPRLARVSHFGSDFLPKRMQLGKTPFIRTFDVFLLPEIKSAAWAKPLFKYIQNEYRQIIDVKFNKSAISKMLEYVGKGKVFDIGCGDGLATEVKPDGIEFFGVDLVEEMVEAAKLEGEEAVVGNIADMDSGILPSPFDGAIMPYVDHWLGNTERQRAFGLVNQVLKEGGQFVFNVYFPQGEWQKYYQDILREAGFSRVVFREEEVESRDGKKIIHLVIACK